MLKDISLTKKFALFTGVTLALSCSLIVLISLILSFARISSTVDERVISATDAYNQYVVDWLGNKATILKTLSLIKSEQQAIPTLKLIKSSGSFDNVFIAFKDGSQINADQIILPQENNDPRKWGWYKNATMQPNKIFMDNPSVAAATGKTVVSLGLVIPYLDGEVVVGADIELTDILHNLAKLKLPNQGVAFIINSQGRIFAHADRSKLNKSALEVGITPEMIEIMLNNNVNSLTVELEQPVVMWADEIKGTDLYTISMIDKEKLNAPIYNLMYKQIILSVIAVLISIVLIYWLSSYLIKPLAEVAVALNSIAKGDADLTRRLEIKSDDEVGQVSSSFNQFVQTLQTLVQSILDKTNQLVEVAKSTSNEISHTGSDLGKQTIELEQAVTAATEFSYSSEEIFNSTKNSSEKSERTKSTVKKAIELANEAAGSMSNLNDQLSQSNDIMESLNQQSQQIDDIINTISNIAEQTNLLALNAAIEAARAGEQGRGFAVVADEVRELSKKTQQSTAGIRKTISSLQALTATAVSNIDTCSAISETTIEKVFESSKYLNESGEYIDDISQMAIEIATASEQQLNVTKDITKSLTATGELSQSSLSRIRENKEAIELLESQANALLQSVGAFKV
ncbi:methyl-accepting chemotaxis protein [Pseudoalteromonas sp.]|uniref:methyl-accepting chemotaxis protein n=1 Tax=Pseudoalteromonas sp. TaxID=53249 RepID=UPI0035671120